MTTCQECGARNSPRAQWCTQCLVPLGPGTEPEAPSSGPATPPPEPVDTPDAGDPGRRFRTVDDEVEWRCEGCEAWNPLIVTSCPVCGQPMGGTGVASTWSGERVARARRVLWVAALVVCLLAIGAVVVGFVAARGAG